jgi:hypothetical protein
MTPDFDPNLEALIDRRLKELPDLAAPSGLVTRTMKALTGAAAAHPRRSAWPAWPAGWRAAFLILASVGLAALFLGWRNAAPAVASLALPWLARVAAFTGVIWNTLSTLTDAVALVLRHFGNGVVLAVLLLGAVAYAACVGFGTLLIRLASAPPEKYRL